MTIVYSEEAKAALFEISDFIDSINTEGAGDRWMTRLTDWVREYALSNFTYALCSNEYLASLGLSCINFNDWIIAFGIEDDLFIVHKIVRGSLLV